MSNFKPGQKVVCIANKCGWENCNKKAVPGPDKNEVCTILAIKEDGFLKLQGYEKYRIWFVVKEAWYDPRAFRPLETHSASIEAGLLESLPLTVKETIDTPVKETV